MNRPYTVPVAILHYTSLDFEILDFVATACHEKRGCAAFGHGAAGPREVRGNGRFCCW